MTPPDDIAYPSTPFPLQRSLVLLGRRGSEAHGTYVPPEDPDAIDDRDLMGICVPPARFYLGLDGFRTNTVPWEGADAIQGVWDVVLYEYRKFVGLLVKQNPNVLSMLWLAPEDYLYVDPVIGQALLDQRLLFRHRDRAYAAFTGYAAGQLRKMEVGAFRGYMGAKRKTLVERHGFDSKNAAHAIRLLHMGIEYLRTGALQVRRTEDLAILIDIKRGVWPLGRVKEYAEELLAMTDVAYERSVLPQTMDEEHVEQMVIGALKTRLFR